MTTFASRAAYAACASIACGCVTASSASADPATLTILPHVPGMDRTTAEGISADGLTIVGTSRVGVTTGTPSYAFRWSAADGMTALPLPTDYERAYGYEISSNGSTIVGLAMQYSNSGGKAFRWTQSSGSSVLPMIPGGTRPETFTLGVSGDGNRTLGRARGADNIDKAVYWDGLNTPVEIGRGTAVASSHDGSIITGFNPLMGDKTFLWTQATGPVTLAAPVGFTRSTPSAINDAGDVIVGTAWGVQRQSAYRWSASTGMVALPLLGDWTASEATDVSADGSVIVGNLLPVDIFSGNPTRPFYWSQATGTVLLASVLYPAIPADWDLRSVEGVSDDGRVFTGTIHRNGEFRAFVATIPSPSTLTLVGVSILVSRRRRR